MILKKRTKAKNQLSKQNANNQRKKTQLYHQKIVPILQKPSSYATLTDDILNQNYSAQIQQLAIFVVQH